MHAQSSFWDALAAYHSAIEDNYLDLASLRRMLSDIQSRVLIIGAGQGLLVAELQRKGYQCDGVDFSSEMIRHAKQRRGLDLIQADASALPLRDATYETVIYATGVIDFNGDETAIRSMLKEGRRVLKPGGKILVAFYRFSAALENFLAKVGLLSDHVLQHRRSLETYLFTPRQTIRWVGKNARIGWPGALVLVIRMAVFGTFREKMTTLKMYGIMSRMENPQSFIQAAPETQPYRNRGEIVRLFERLDVPVKGLRTLGTCWVVQV